MRAGPLSNINVIELLNSSYVPVTLPNEDYKNGRLKPQERAWIEQWHTAGLVEVSIIGPDETPIKMLHIMYANTAEQLLPVLQNITKDLHTQPGTPAFAPQPQSVAPVADKTSLVMHLTARGSIDEKYPGETWLVFTQAEVNQFLPQGDPKPGTTWTVPKELASRILVHFYPQMISSDRPENNVIVDQSFTGKVLSMGNGVVRARLDATLTMKRSYYPQPNPQTYLVNASIVGFVDFALHEDHVHAIKLATFKAASDGREFDVVLTSTPHRYAEPIEK
jgi:hypothetical protein